MKNTPTSPSACPICKGPVDPNAGPAPFCSSRCQLIDLGNWLGEGYSIPARDTSMEDSAPHHEVDEEDGAD